MHGTYISGGPDEYVKPATQHKRYYSFLCPATLAFISFILVVLTIIAGQNPGFINADDYSIVYVSILP